MLDECDDKVTNKDVAEFLLSKVVEDGLEIIKRAEAGETPIWLSTATPGHHHDDGHALFWPAPGRNPKRDHGALRTEKEGGRSGGHFCARPQTASVQTRSTADER